MRHGDDTWAETQTRWPKASSGAKVRTGIFLALARRVAGEGDLARKRSLIIPGFLVKFVYLFSIALLDHFAAKF